MSESAFERVKLARDSKRPTGLDYIKNIFKGFIEFHGDRRYADDPAIVGGIAKLNDTPVTVIAIEKDRLRAWKLLVKIHQYRHIRAAPFVYILVRIPHHEQVLVCCRQNLQ